MARPPRGLFWWVAILSSGIVALLQHDLAAQQPRPMPPAQVPVPPARVVAPPAAVISNGATSLSQKPPRNPNERTLPTWQAYLPKRNVFFISGGRKMIETAARVCRSVAERHDNTKKRYYRFDASRTAQGIAFVARWGDAANEQVLNHLNSLELMLWAGFSLPDRDSAESLLALLLSRARGALDKEIFPPLGKGGNSPLLALGALASTIGPALNPGAIKDPAIFVNVRRYVAAWEPDVSDDYDPGWKHEDPTKTLAERAALVDKLKEGLLKPLDAQIRLAADPEYPALARKFQEKVGELGTLNIYGGDSDYAFGCAIPNHGEVVAKHAQVEDEASALGTQMRLIEWRLAPERRWHARVGWKAEEFFDDPAVIALCHAIEETDLNTMRQLLVDGVDVNAVGKDGMRPLLWAFPEQEQIARFELLLDAGANPDFCWTADLLKKSEMIHPPGYSSPYGIVEPYSMHAGQSLIELAASSRVSDYLRLILEHGGDPNFASQRYDYRALNVAIGRYRKSVPENVRLLLHFGASLNAADNGGCDYPLILAIKENQFDLALELLQRGAESRVENYPAHPNRFDHWEMLWRRVSEELERDAFYWGREVSDYVNDERVKTRAELETLLDWLAQHGVSLYQVGLQTRLNDFVDGATDRTYHFSHDYKAEDQPKLHRSKEERWSFPVRQAQHRRTQTYLAQRWGTGQPPAKSAQPAPGNLLKAKPAAAR